MRKAIGVVVAVLVLVAGCGGDDGEETREVELEPIAAVEACDLLDASKAEELAGAEVEAAGAAEDDPNTCEFAFADESVGSGIAASLRLEEGDESDVPGGGVAQALRLGDRGAVEATDTAVKVVYVVREVVVRIEVTPAGGVDDSAVERVVAFAEETEAPVVEAVTGEAPVDDGTTTTEAPTTTEATTTTAADVTDADVEALWSRTATEFRDRVGEQFTFECPAGGTPRTIWGDQTTGYTDDSSVCTAGVHAGAITIDEGGDVLIQMVPGQPSYPSTEANGITSQEWPEWPGGFLVLNTD